MNTIPRMNTKKQNQKKNQGSKARQTQDTKKVYQEHEQPELRMTR